MPIYSRYLSIFLLCIYSLSSLYLPSIYALSLSMVFFLCILSVLSFLFILFILSVRSGHLSSLSYLSLLACLSFLPICPIFHICPINSFTPYLSFLSVYLSRRLSYFTSIHLHLSAHLSIPWSLYPVLSCYPYIYIVYIYTYIFFSIHLAIQPWQLSAGPTPTCLPLQDRNGTERRITTEFALKIRSFRLQERIPPRVLSLPAVIKG
jgi:hypothetical protein